MRARWSRGAIPRGAIGVCLLTLALALPSGTPSAAAATPTTDAPDLKRVDAFVGEAMRERGVPGAAIVVAHDGKIVHAKGFGVTDARGRPVTPQTPFRVGSLTKSFTALAVMQLVEEGKIDLRAPARRYLPWFRLKGSACRTPTPQRGSPWPTSCTRRVGSSAPRTPRRSPTPRSPWSRACAGVARRRPQPARGRLPRVLEPELQRARPHRRGGLRATLRRIRRATQIGPPRHAPQHAPQLRDARERGPRRAGGGSPVVLRRAPGDARPLHPGTS